MKKIILLLLTCLSPPTIAQSFILSSNDLVSGEHMSSDHEYIGFGCKGKNLSPHLKWSGAPAETKSFAITVYDPDAPTGSGWWHWQLINISKNINEISQGAGDISKPKTPKNSLQIENDYGKSSFGGACPPPGHKSHRYQFTVYALSTEKIEVDSNASGALVGYLIKSHALASSTIETLYKRD